MENKRDKAPYHINSLKYSGWKGRLIFMWKGHVINWFWLPREKRRNNRLIVHRDLLTKYLRKFIPYIESLKPSPVKDSTSVNNKVFSLWLQGEDTAPEVVKKCFGSFRKYFGSDFTLIDETNLGDYITLPEFIMEKWDKGEISAAHYSDVVRVELLWKYGGYWIDSTCFVTGEIPEVIKNADFFMYLANGNSNPQMFVQNCFIRSKQGDPLLGMWRELMWEFLRREDYFKYYFTFQQLFKLLVTHNSYAKALFDKMPKICMDPTHCLWYEIGNKPFNEKEYHKMCSEAFFQKCSYKRMRHGVNEILPGSFADYVMNGKV